MRGGVATFAVVPGFTPKWIFPLYTPTNYYFDVVADFDLQMYRPLYAFGRGAQDAANPSLSLADPPVYSNGGRTVTIALKRYLWSDGRPLTTRDVEFDLNLIRANKSLWGPYHAGNLPDDIVSADWISATRFSITFNRVYSHLWLQANQLTDLIPLPQHAWDRTSPTGPVGNYDRTTKGAKAVYAFLAKQAGTVQTYQTNPLWKVDDGPWSLKQFDPTTADTTFVPNRRYSGPVKPRLAAFKLVTFTSEAAEMDALRSGSLTYGYLPYTDINQARYFQHRGYTVAPWKWVAINYAETDHTSPVSKAMLNQLYVRQALQHLVDQPAYIKTFLDGYGTPDYGPVPALPGSPLADSFERHNPYPYSIKDAVTILRRHGWAIHRNGVDRCIHPGAVATACGAGIARGQKLSLRFLYGAGTEATLQEVETLRSAASRAGVQLNLQSHSINGLYSLNSLCTSSPQCNWDLVYFSGEGATWNFGPPSDLPTGGQIFGTGNYWGGGYSDPTANRLIEATHTQSSLSALHAYEDYLARQVPVMWMPVPDLQISVISKRLHGWGPQSSLQEIYPEQWYLTK
ncbi:MAG TPA: ABC transporter substrate-binding protein [Candidatus Micrarchaeia archaeon]|nr:ABC transporter substrate-binding protein [Candidatus Micrarchaeia archaeon]